MERRKLEESFCLKISGEIKTFKTGILRKKKKVIMESAYEIDHMVRIFEILIEWSQKLDSRQLENCLSIPGLLTFLYSEWLKLPDGQNEEEEQAILRIIENKQPNAEEGGKMEGEKINIHIKYK